MVSANLIVTDEAAMLALGEQLAQATTAGMVIYLSGELGAGKTTLVRGFLIGCDYQGHVKSPTYSLVETYQLARHNIYHYDLYRIAAPEELEFMGFRDYFSQNASHLIEWPEKAQGFLPAADLAVQLVHQAEQRQVTLLANTPNGQRIINQLAISSGIKLG